MTPTQEQLDTARRMRARGAMVLRELGMPTRNPFPDDTLPELARAWREGYFPGRTWR